MVSLACYSFVVLQAACQTNGQSQNFTRGMRCVSIVSSSDTTVFKSLPLRDASVDFATKETKEEARGCQCKPAVTLECNSAVARAKLAKLQGKTRANYGMEV